MKMAKWLIPVTGIAMLTATLGCNSVIPGVVNGSGRAETRDFSLTGFSKVQAAAAFQIEVDRSDSYSVRVTADDNLWDVLDVSESGGTLHLQTKPGKSVINSTLKATVTMPELTGIDLSGASRATLDGFSSDKAMAFEVSGASKAELSNTKFGKTALSISGASTVSGSAVTADINLVVSGAGVVTLEGSGTTGKINASGAARADLDEFKLQSVGVTLSGAAQAKVDAQKIDPANLSGGAHLYYVGNPTIGGLSTSGGAQISRE
jgi:hypothetical protein